MRPHWPRLDGKCRCADRSLHASSTACPSLFWYRFPGSSAGEEQSQYPARQLEDSAPPTRRFSGATAVALLAMLEQIYMLERAAKEARGLPTGRPAKLYAATRAGAAQRIKASAIPNRSPPTSASAAPGCTGHYASTAKAPLSNPSARKADYPNRPHHHRSGATSLVLRRELRRAPHRCGNCMGVVDGTFYDPWSWSYTRAGFGRMCRRSERRSRMLSSSRGLPVRSGTRFGM